MDHEDTRKVVKLMANVVAETDRISQPVKLPRKLIVGLMALGFGAVFGVLGMFFLPYAKVVSLVLIPMGGVSGVVGAVLVMKFAGDSRFDPSPVVNTHPEDKA